MYQAPALVHGAAIVEPLLRRFAVPMAIASDLNPATSPVLSLRLTPEETLAGVTIHAVRALGLDSRKGSIEVGKDADFVAWDITALAELA